MRSSLRVGVLCAVALIVVIGAPGVARAGAWYYTWQCSGGCAPGQLAISGVEGPFASYEQCDGARSGDSRRDYFLAEGNLGGLNLCEEADAPPSPSASGGGGTRAAVVARLMVAGVVGGGYRVEDATGIEASTGTTGGFEIDVQFGGHPIFGLEVGLGYQQSSVTAPHFGPDAHTIEFVPLTIGFASTPALFHGDAFEVRLDLGASLGDYFRIGCDDCDADMLQGDAILGIFRGGIDTYFGRERSFGIGVAGVYLTGSQGNLHDDVSPSLIEIRPPTYLLRVTFLSRHHDGVAW
jgi:hypothetical protein